MATTTERSHPTAEDLGYDIYNAEMVAQPHAVYRRLRHEAPVAWSRTLKAWCVSRYEDVQHVLRHPDLFSSRSRQPGGPAEGQARPDQHREQMAPPGTMTMMLADEPDHARLRKILDRDFTPRKVAALEPHIQTIADRLLKSAADRDTFDLMERLGIPLPVTVIAELLGIPPERGDDFKRWSAASNLRFLPDSPQEEIDTRNAAVVEFREYLQAQIAARRREPTDDLIGRLVAARDDEERLTDDELLASIELLLLAGNETTTSLIGNAVLALLRHPDQLQLLRDEPERMDDAVEEVLRYDGTVQIVIRIATADTEVAGQAIAAGDLVLPMIAAANRDEELWERAEEFDIARDRSRHLAFGDWIHVCLGQYIARIETKVALRTLLRTFPELEAATPLEELPYNRGFMLRGLAHFPVHNAPA